MAGIQGFLDVVGEGVSQITQTIISSIANLGVSVTLIQAKVINMLIIFILLYIFVKVVRMARRPLQMGIIALLVFLAVSIGVSFIV